MVRIFSFLILLAMAALGAAWIADQNGGVVLSWNGWRAETSLPVLALIVLIIVIAALLAWTIIRAFWKAPARLRHRWHERRRAKARHAITQGLIAIGTGDSSLAHRYAGTAKRLAEHDPLTLLLQAQTAQLEGDRPGAQRAFHAMAERKDMRLLGLRGLFIEAQRNDDLHTAVATAEEALKIAPTSSWASHAVLGFRCARSDWDGALDLLDSHYAASLIETAPYRRSRGVLLTARALELEERDRDLARKSVMEAIKYAPQLVPAAVLAAKFYSEDNQIRRAMRTVEAAWTANPHPDLADAYAHVRLGDSARERLARVEMLAQKAPDDRESRLAVARAAIEASEFDRAREALAPLLAAPTQRVALLMADLERAGNHDEGRAREWTARAVRAAPDPAWTADGYVSDRWRPVSPVTGRLDAFQWMTPVAALVSERPEIEVETPRVPELDLPAPSLPEPSLPESTLPESSAADPQAPAAIETDIAAAGEAEPAVADAPVEASPQAAKPENVAPPVFRPRPAGEPRVPAPQPAVIPLVRAPDDPGVPEGDFPDDPEAAYDRQPGGWRGFVSRLGG
ncbi:Putative protoheme IX biogenesis protein OS=Afipia felis OX=1035 GN=NCTC12722_00280 PE=4 SV=1 [Afipia felis]